MEPEVIGTLNPFDLRSNKVSIPDIYIWESEGRRRLSMELRLHGMLTIQGVDWLDDESHEPTQYWVPARPDPCLVPADYQLAKKKTPDILLRDVLFSVVAEKKEDLTRIMRDEELHSRHSIPSWQPAGWEGRTLVVPVTSLRTGNFSGVCCPDNSPKGNVEIGRQFRLTEVPLLQPNHDASRPCPILRIESEELLSALGEFFSDREVHQAMMANNRSGLGSNHNLWLCAEGAEPKDLPPLVYFE